MLQRRSGKNRDWGVRSDTVYNAKTRRHSIQLADDQINDQGVEPKRGTISVNSATGRIYAADRG